MLNLVKHEEADPIDQAAEDNCWQKTQRNILVTGFGPFAQHPINASWEVVKLLPRYIDNDLGVNLIIEEIPVKYDVVEKKIPELWKEHDPVIVIHVGVSHLAKELTLERCAKQKGYCRPDIVGQVPATKSCCIGTEAVLYSSLDILGISQRINRMKTSVKTCVSSDAGRYLCEFIYYTSLNHATDRCLFVHVPCLEKPYTAEEMAQGLSHIVKSMLEQVSCEEKVFENAL